MSPEELASLPVTVDLETAARALGIGRTTAYQLARAGEFPVRVLRLGARYRIPTAELRAVLGYGAGEGRFPLEDVAREFGVDLDEP